MFKFLGKIFPRGEKDAAAAGRGERALTVTGIVLCLILIPILIVNCTLLIKGLANPDEVPGFGGLSPLIVLSGSMTPDFPEGSLIMVKKTDPSEIREGDIISYFDPASKSGAVVTHKVRFLKTDEEGAPVFLTYGTANTSKDFEEVTELDCERIPADKLVGRYTGFHLKGAGHVAIFLQTVPGLILCVFVPLLLFVGYDILRRRRFERSHEDEKDELLRELEELRRLKAETAGEASSAESTVAESTVAESTGAESAASGEEDRGGTASEE